MAGLCGWITTESGGERPDVLECMLASLRGAAQPQSAVRAGWALAVAGDGYPEAALHRGSRVAAALIGKPEFSHARLAAIARESGPAAALAAAYEEKGERCFAAIHGAFAAAIVDDAARTCIVAIDRMGVHSVCYAEAAGSLLFGSTTDSVRAHPQVAAEISPQGVFNYVYFHVVPGPDTIYRGLRRLPPGGYVRFARGAIETGTYWQMAYREVAPHDIGRLEAEFRDLMERSVRKLLNGRAVGAFLSGGTDSSTVAGMLGRVTGKPAKTYSIGFEAEGYDEMEYARIAARHFGTEHHEYYVTPDDVLELMQRLARSCDQPFGNSSAVPTYFCARMAKADGVALLLAGDGGDELFGGNERYAKQTIFGLYDKVPQVLRRDMLEPLLFAMPGGHRITPVRKARSYVRQASVPMPARLQTYNLLNRTPLDRAFTEEFLGAVDPGTPGRLFDSVYHSAEAQSMLNRMLALDLQFTLADNDLYKVNRMCELAEIGVAYPMLDDDVVAFSGRLPSGLKLKGTTLRYFFKRALRDFLPREIIAKKKHGFGLPVGVWMRTHATLRELAYDTLQGFKARHVMRPAFIDEMIREHRSGHAAYWGEQIWVLVVLELWLQAHGWPRGRSLS